ncbi:hypothetical protein I4U23_001019 [Adineta vaga]|nr:hypothetical protein I4U23_001019 [Adineta vaga]
MLFSDTVKRSLKIIDLNLFSLGYYLNGLEHRTGFDLNGDGYIGGQERAFHMDLNGDGMIGRPYDVHYAATAFRTGHGGNTISSQPTGFDYTTFNR